MDWNQSKDLIIGFLGSGFATWILYELHSMRKSMEELNIQIAVIIQRTTDNERRIDRLEENTLKLKRGN